MNRLTFTMLLVPVLLAAGCGGSGGGPSVDRFAGTYTGTWTAVGDAEDTGTSTWTISPDGTVTGKDVDPSTNTTYTVVGTINRQGQLSSMSTPNNDAGPATLDGRLQFDNQGRLAGTLVWGVTPPISYNYTFSRD